MAWPGARCVRRSARGRHAAAARGRQGEPQRQGVPQFSCALPQWPQHKLLFSTGALADSLESDRTGDVLGFGSPLPYAVVHQTGSRDGSLRKREYVGISREFRKSLDSIFPADFERGL